MTVRWKLTLAIVAAMTLLAGLVAWRVQAAGEETVRLTSARALRTAEAGLDGLVRADVERLQTALELLGRDPRLQEAYRARDRERFLAEAAPIFEGLRREHDVTHCYVHEPTGLAWVRVHAPTQFGDQVNRVTLARAISTGGLGAGVELGRNGLALRVVEPWRVGGAVVGYLELGEEVEHFLGRMRQQTGDHYALLLHKDRLDEAAWRAFYGPRRPWGDDPAAVVADDTLGDPTALAGAAQGDPAATRQLPALEREGRTLARGVVPLRDAGGQVVGRLVVLSDVTDLREGLAGVRNALLGLVLSAAALLAVLLAWLTKRLVFDRLDRMTATIEDLGTRMAGGDYDLPAPGRSGPDDEIGRFEGFFGRFLQVVGGLLKELTAPR